MLSNKIIKIGEYIYRIYDYTTPDKLELGNAYIFGGKAGKNRALRYTYVLPFKGKYYKDVEEPGIYIDKSDNMIVVNPKTVTDKAIYSIDRILEINPDTINSELNRYLQEIDVNDLKYNGNIFAPKIKKEDDVGIKAIRLALIAKQIDFGSYKNRFPKLWAVSNTRKALLQDSTLTFTKLDEYSKIFDFNFGVIIFDRKNAKDPISSEGKAMIVFNDDEFPINDPMVQIVRSPEDVLGDSTIIEENNDEDLDIEDAE